MTSGKDLCSARDGGFTLIELMVAMILLGFIFLLLTSALQFGSKVWNSRDERSNSSDILTTQYFLRRLLSEIRPVMIEADINHGRQVVFTGDQNSIRFIGMMPGQLGVAGLYDVAIYPVEDVSANRVEISWHLVRAETSSARPAEDLKETLIRGVNQIEFAYYGTLRKDQPARWYDSWQNADRLPELIRMRVTLNTAGHIWPDLVVRPMVRTLNPIIDSGTGY